MVNLILMEEKNVMRKEFSDFAGKLSDFEELFSNYEKAPEKIQVDISVKSVALIYEKMRNSVGYQQEQMLRRIAIERFLNRKLHNTPDSDKIAQILIKELIHSGYLENNKIPIDKIKDVSKIIVKYLEITKHSSPEAIKYASSLASAEIEHTLSISYFYEDALLDTFIDIIEKEIKSENYHQALLLSATVMTFKKADVPTVRYHLLKHYLPAWFKENVEITPELKAGFNTSIKYIEQTLEHPDIHFYTQIVKKFYPIFLIIRKIVDKNPQNASEIIKNKESLSAQINSATMEYYQSALTKLNRSIIKAVLFVFITKIVVGLIMEIPYEFYIAKKINYLPIAINLAFPPVLMFVSAYLISVPGVENTRKIILITNELIYSNSSDYIEKSIKSVSSKRESNLSMILNFFFFLTFVIIIGFLIWMLFALNFNPVSGFLFFLFLSTVSFLAFRIRQTSNELNISDSMGGSGLTGVMDFLLLPFLRIGFWLSKKFEKYNIFLYIFDFILEAPFKIILGMLEQWIGFIREKKEEIVS